VRVCVSHDVCVHVCMCVCVFVCKCILLRPHRKCWVVPIGTSHTQKNQALIACTHTHARICSRCLWPTCPALLRSCPAQQRMPRTSAASLPLRAWAAGPAPEREPAWRPACASCARACMYPRVHDRRPPGCTLCLPYIHLGSAYTSTDQRTRTLKDALALHAHVVCMHVRVSFFGAMGTCTFECE